MVKMVKIECVPVEAVTLQLNSPLVHESGSDYEAAQSKMKERWRRVEGVVELRRNLALSFQSEITHEHMVTSINSLSLNPSRAGR